MDFNNAMLQALIDTARKYPCDTHAQWFIRGQASGLAAANKIQFWQQEYANNVSKALERGVAA